MPNQTTITDLAIISEIEMIQEMESLLHLEEDLHSPPSDPSQVIELPF